MKVGISPCMLCFSDVEGHYGDFLRVVYFRMNILAFMCEMILIIMIFLIIS